MKEIITPNGTKVLVDETELEEFFEQRPYTD